MKKFRYASNNSGGDWWLSENDWKKLEAAGWAVEWTPEPFLGARATTATKEFLSSEEAVENFERVTGLDYYEQGCPCCGSPHFIAECWESPAPVVSAPVVLAPQIPQSTKWQK